MMVTRKYFEGNELVLMMFLDLTARCRVDEAPWFPDSQEFFSRTSCLPASPSPFNSLFIHLRIAREAILSHIAKI